MKTMKPTKLGVLWKTFELEQKNYLSISLLVFCDLGEPGSAGFFGTEVDMWKLAAAELGKDAMLDECMPKERGEALVHGNCYAPGGVPQQGGQVRLRMGSIDKTLYVFGDRTWQWHGAMSYPEPFTVMPVSWSTAFGGEGFERNPLGKGVPVKKDGEPHRLPNVEDPKHLIKSKGDRPTPVGFEPYDLLWPQRWSKLGTYDAAWAKEVAPGLARDVDMTMFNAAPEGQQIEGFFRGDEAFVVENMHPTRPILEGRLPGVVARCFLTRAGEVGAASSAELEIEEIPAHLDTVRIFPHQERMVLTFRAVTTVAEDDAADVIDLLAGFEDMADPRPIEHYRAVRARRLEKGRGALHALRDGDLSPARAIVLKKDRRFEPTDPEALVETEGLLRKNLRERARLEAEKTRRSIEEAGGDPDAYDIPDLSAEDEPLPDVEDMAAFVDKALALGEEQQKMGDAQRAKAEAGAREAYAACGLDYDAALGAAKDEPPGPPKLSAKREIERLREVQELAKNGGVETPELDRALEDDELEKKLASAERRMVESYQQNAHFMPAAARLGDEEARAVRERVIQGYAAGERFDGRDFTGADLSGLDLTGASFCGAFLESASLRGSTLIRCDFTGAVLARADFSDADLTSAKFEEANLGAALLARAKLEGADLRSSILWEADLGGAELCRADLSRADIALAKLVGADMRGSIINEALFLRNDLRGARLGEADLTSSIFIEVALEGADLTSAKLTGATFVTANAERAVLVNAAFDNARVVEGSTLEGADLRGISATRTNLRGTNLKGADLSGATLDQSDLSECDLRGAKLYRIVAKGAMFVRADLRGASLVGANLLEAILQKAKLAGANFTGANLFRADMARAVGDDTTSFERANVKYVRSTAKRDHG